MYSSRSLASDRFNTIDILDVKNRKLRFALEGGAFATTTCFANTHRREGQYLYLFTIVSEERNPLVGHVELHDSQAAAAISPLCDEAMEELVSGAFQLLRHVRCYKKCSF